MSNGEGTDFEAGSTSTASSASTETATTSGPSAEVSVSAPENSGPAEAPSESAPAAESATLEASVSASGEAQPEASEGDAAASEADLSSWEKSASELPPDQSESADSLDTETANPLATWTRANGAGTGLEQNSVQPPEQPTTNAEPHSRLDQIKEGLGKAAHAVLHPGYEAIQEVRKEFDKNEDVIAAIPVVGDRLVGLNEAYKKLEDRLGVHYKKEGEGEK